MGLCARTDEVLNVLRQSKVDLLLLDFNLGTERGSDLINAVRQAGYTGKILMVTAAMDAPEAMKALQLGASGVFLKHNSPSVLTQAIHMVASGEIWLDRRIVQLLADQVATSPPDGFGTPLTEREEKVLNGVLEGSSNRKIAEDVGGTEGSIKAAVQQLFRKTGVRTRSQLVRAALEGHIQLRPK